jgi:DNA/RNA-binding domain of Phe-tRNA-synthetase-like protein
LSLRCFLHRFDYNKGMLTIDPHPLLDLRAFRTYFPRPLAELPATPDILALFSLNAAAPLTSDDHVRQTVRELLRAGGFKPTGRSKPSAEYLIKAVEEGRLTTINLAVDVCNAVSLHSGLPITVIDLDRARPPLRVAVAPPDSSYVFNASGQTIDLGGLICLMDADGPCGNAVKDAQRTKTGPATQNTLSLIWGSTALAGRAAAAEAWYRQLLHQHDANTELVAGVNGER